MVIVKSRGYKIYTYIYEWQNTGGLFDWQNYFAFIVITTNMLKNRHIPIFTNDNILEDKIILSIEQTSSILSFVNIGIYFISMWLYYNQIVVTFRLGTRLSSSNQISVLNTPLYCRKVTIVKQHYCKYYCIPFIYIYILLLLNICINTRTFSYIWI
jgi:hypothetical protein